jgi:RNA polymerase sigma factor (sigma-70 family)
MPSASDATLLAQARLGRTDAFEALVLRHQSLVCAITFSLLGDRSLSEDVAQETFLAAWRARDEVREPERFRAWLCSTARNLAAKARRRLGRTTELADRELADDRVGLEDGLAARESEAMVWRALESVPEAYREPLVLYYREGRSATQVAELLGLSVSAVEQRLSRGRRHLKQEVEDLVERTLERSRPSAGFAAAVMVALPTVSPSSTSEPSSASEPSSTSEPTPRSEADSVRPGSTSMITILSKALVATGIASVLAVGAHAAITREEAPSEHASATSDVAGVQPTTALTPGAGEPKSADARAEREELSAARAELERSAGAVVAAEAGVTSDYQLTRMSAKQVAVELTGGPSKLTSYPNPFAGPEPATPETLRTIRGRVLDEAGRPIAGAVVMGGKSLNAFLGNSLTAQAGTTTGTDGSFALALWDADAKVVLALHRAGWSPVTMVAAGTDDLALDLHLRPTAALEGTVTRGGAALEAQVSIATSGDAKLRMLVPTDAQGRYRVDRLPPGELEVSAMLSHDAGLGSGSRAMRPLSLTSGETGRVDLDLPTGAHVTVEAEVPEGVRMMSYTLVVGEHEVPDGATLTRLKAELPQDQWRSTLYGGIDLDEVMQFSDVSPGPVTLCVEALIARDELLGLACKVIEVGEGGKGEYEVRLQPAGE